MSAAEIPEHQFRCCLADSSGRIRNFPIEAGEALPAPGGIEHLRSSAWFVHANLVPIAAERLNAV
ncbi:hypothetical protein [Mesorhizobium sp. LjNodule214]|uniref:hypothetical protein n=1 Tax=Mesorhizobium sp. LjNodule214 TaxID=3342252 RepID=UPI003ECC9078